MLDVRSLTVPGGRGSRPRTRGLVLAKAAASDDGYAESGTCLRSWCGYGADFLLLAAQHRFRHGGHFVLYSTRTQV